MSPSSSWPFLSRRLMRRCRRDPIFFCAGVLGGDAPWGRQAEILLALRDAPRVAVRSGHGVGKTWTAARAAVWFLYSHPNSIVLTTAPTQRQVRAVLWTELRRQIRQAGHPLGGQLTETALKIADGWYALGLATDEPERFQGYHAEHILLIFDEAPGVAEAIYEAARGVLTTRASRFLLLGNPTVAQGPFYDAFRRPGWRTIHIPCTASPNVAAGRVILPNLVTREWIETQREEWGEDSPLFRSRVLGEFPEEGDASLIPLAWIHAAQERAEPRPSGAPAAQGERKDSSVPAKGGCAAPSPARTAAPALGVDVARYGTDQTVLALASRERALECLAFSGLSTMETCGRIIAFARRHAVPAGRIAVDDTGVGGGVTDRLREQGFPVLAVNAAGRADHPAFANRRAELFWSLREAFAPDAACPLALPARHERLAADLAALTYGFNSRGQIQVLAKDALRARLGRSPDHADALALAFAALRPPVAPPRAWFL